MRRIGLCALVFAFVVSRCGRLHVAVRPDFREVHRLVAPLCEVQCGGVRHVPAIGVDAPEVDVGHLGEQGVIRDFAVGRGNRVVGVFGLDGGGRGLQRCVPDVQRPFEPLRVVVVLVAQLPTQDGRVVLELRYVVEVGARLQVEDAALIVPETGNDREAGGVDLVEHCSGGDGLVYPNRVDAEVLHDGEVLRQRLKAAGFLPDRNGVVTDGLDEVRAFFREELTLVRPDPGARFGAGGQGEAQQQGNRCDREGELGHDQGVGSSTWRSSMSRWPA